MELLTPYTVSYTHLDVYKRQLFHRAELAPTTGRGFRAHYLFHIGIPLATNGTTSYPLGRLCPTVIAKVNRFCLCHTIYTICLLRNSAHVIAAATATLSDSEVGCPTG